MKYILNAAGRRYHRPHSFHFASPHTHSPLHLLFFCFNIFLFECCLSFIISTFFARVRGVVCVCYSLFQKKSVGVSASQIRQLLVLYFSFFSQKRIFFGHIFASHPFKVWRMPAIVGHILLFHTQPFPSSFFSFNF